MRAREITGRQVFAVTAAAFAVIIGVNAVLAWKAIATFPGLEVRNSYVASQSFDADRAAQEALGWNVAARVGDGRLVLTIDGRDGRPVVPETIEATVGRATHVAEDRVLTFAFDGRAHVAPVDLAPGNWSLRLTARAADGTPFRQRIALTAGGGT